MNKTKEDIALAYDSEPWWYDVRGFFILTFAYNNTLTRQIKFFAKNFGPKHIEIGCGSGTLLEIVLYFRKWKKLSQSQITAIDYAEPMLIGARRRFAKWSDVEVQHGDAGHLSFADASFDTANIANSVHCFPEVDKALHETFRILKPGGTLALNVLLYPRGMWPWKAIANSIDNWGMRKGILYTPYEKNDIRQRILNAGFELDSESISGNCYYAVARKPVL